MKQNISKFFNRNKLINNRLFALNKQTILQDVGVTHLVENISVIKRNFERNVCYMGPNVTSFLQKAPDNFKPNNLFICDISLDLLKAQLKGIHDSGILKHRYPNLKIRTFDDDLTDGSIYGVCCEEELWPFGEDQLQLIVSNLHLHHVNDISVAMIRWLKSMEPDGTLVGSIIGGETLQELRISYTLAENERYGGVSQHVLPFLQITEMGNILSRLEYTIPSVYNYSEQLQFKSVLHLLQFLQESGEGDSLVATRDGVYRETLEGMIAVYNKLFSDQTSIYATFEYINFTGWKHHPDQMKPLERGSAEFSLKEISSDIETNGVEPHGFIHEEEDEPIDKKKQ